VRANTAQQRMECGMGCLISEPGCDGQRRPREREKRLGQGIRLRARRRRSRMRRSSPERISCCTPDRARGQPQMIGKVRRLAEIRISRRAACREEKFERGPCCNARQGHKRDLRALGIGKEDDAGRDRPHIGAGCGGTDQDAAKPVMVRWMPGKARSRSVLGTIISVDSAGEGKSRSRRGRSEEGLQQKCVEREHADRGPLCQRSSL
jgi:hypothetical protein